MSILTNKAKASMKSAPFYMYSMRSISLSYFNLPFPANSDAEAVSRIRQTVNRPDFDKSTLSDLQLVRVGRFDSIVARPFIGEKFPPIIVEDLSVLLSKEDQK